MTLYTCASCHRVKLNSEWRVLTALEVLRLKARKEQIEVKATFCPECAERLKLPKGDNGNG